MANKLIAIVAGVGAGTGSSIARKFASAYPVVLLARSPDSYESLVEEINGNGGKAIGISTDVADAQSVTNAFDRITSEFGNDVGAAVSGFAICLREEVFVFAQETRGFPVKTKKSRNVRLPFSMQALDSSGSRFWS